MDAVIDHVSAHWIPYVVALAALAPVIYFTRRWSLSIIQWTIELVVYFIVFHGAVHYIVRALSWLKSEMGVYDEDRVDPGWTTPLVEAWDRAQYNPVGVFYFECVMLALFALLVARTRRFKVQKPKPRIERTRRGEVPKSLREKYAQPQRDRSGRR